MGSCQTQKREWVVQKVPSRKRKTLVGKERTPVIIGEIGWTGRANTRGTTEMKWKLWGPAGKRESRGGIGMEGQVCMSQGPRVQRGIRTEVREALERRGTDDWEASKLRTRPEKKNGRRRKRTRESRRYCGGGIRSGGCYGQRGKSPCLLCREGKPLLLETCRKLKEKKKRDLRKEGGRKGKIQSGK